MTDKMNELIDAQKFLESESRTLKGELQSLMRKHGATGVDPSVFELRAYLDDKELYQQIAGIRDGIDDRAMLMKEFLPEGFDSLARVAGYANEVAKEQGDEWFNAFGELRYKYQKMIKEAIIGAEVDKCKSGIKAVKRDIFNLTKNEMNSVVAAENANDMISRVENAFVKRQQRLFSDAMGIADDGIVQDVVTSGEIIDVDRLRKAFADAKAIESGKRGSGRAWMEDRLRETFGDAFDSADYERLSEYEDVDELIDDINETCLRVGLYDSDIVRSGIESINPEVLTSVSTAKPSLKEKFGDTFSESEYDSIVDKIITRQDIVERNRKNLSDQFYSLRAKSKVMFGRLIEGLSNEEYKEKWGNEGNSPIEIQHAQGVFDRAIAKIDNDTMIDKRALRRWLENNAGMRDRPYALSRLTIGMQTMDSIEKKNTGAIEAKIRKLLGEKMKDDVFSEEVVEQDVEKRWKKEVGDVVDARSYLASEVQSVVRGTNVDRFATALSDRCRVGVEKSFDATDRLVDEFERKKMKFIENKRKRIQQIKMDAIEDLWATEEDVVSDDSYVVSDDLYWEDLEKEFGKKRVDDWKKTGASIETIEEYKRDKNEIIDRLEAIYGKEHVDIVRSPIMGGWMPEKRAADAIKKQLFEEQWNKWKKTYGKKLVENWKVRSKRMSKEEIIDMIAAHDRNVNAIVYRLENEYGKKNVKFIAPRLKKGTIDESDARRILEEKRS